jgi:hypothetical protein
MILKAVGAIGACIPVAVAAWYAGDYTEMRPVIKKEYLEAQADSTEILKGLVEQQSQMTTSVMELQFQTLTLKRKAGALDWSEEQDRCRIAKRLEYFNTVGCDD